MSDTKSKHSSLPPVITWAPFLFDNIVFFFLVETLVVLDSVTTTFCETVSIIRRPRHVHISFLAVPVQSDYNFLQIFALQTA